MFNFRERKYENDERQVIKLCEFSAQRDSIPLKDNWAERWCTLPSAFQKFFNEFIALKTRPDDAFVVTFMKCGTTWMQEAAWLLQNDLDFERSKTIGLPQRSPYLDWSGLFPHLPNSVKEVDEAPSPRLIKSHMPANLLPKEIWEKKIKVIYVSRNVKDAIVSSYHFIKGLGVWQGNMSEYVEDFINGEIVFTPFWERTLDFWKMRNEPNIFFTTYEEMKRDLGSVLQRLCTFLGKPQLNEEQLKKTLDHLSFDIMKRNQDARVTNSFVSAMPTEVKVTENFQFMRRGIIGSYKDELTADDIRKIDEWTNKILAKYGIKQEDIFGQI